MLPKGDAALEDLMQSIPLQRKHDHRKLAGKPRNGAGQEKLRRSFMFT